MIMKPNELRELDNYLATHVMGWTWDGHAAGVWREYRNGPMATPSFQPTTDPADAMEVLTKCMKQTAAITLFEHHSEIFIGTDDTEIDVKIKADTLELAICQFAKRLFTHPNRKQKR